MVDNFIPQKLHQLPPNPDGSTRFAATKHECLEHCRQTGFERNQGMSHDYNARK